MALQSTDVNAGDDALNTDYNKLRADLLASHHREAGATKIADADVDAAAAIAFSKMAALTASRAVEVSAGGVIVASAVTAVELNYLDGIASQPVANSGNESIDGVKTFTSFPVTPSSAPTTDYQVANKKFVDDLKTELLAGPGPTSAKTYWIFSLPFILSTNVPSGDFWTQINITEITSTISSAYIGINADAVGSIITSGGIWHESRTLGLITFATAKKVIVEFGIELGGIGTDQMGFGLAQNVTPFGDFDDDTVDAACFTVAADGKLYAHTSNAGVGDTNVEITGITVTNTNTYRIEFDPGVNVKFYVNGVLKATISTTLPATAVIQFGAGASGSTDGDASITLPYFAIEK